MSFVYYIEYIEHTSYQVGFDALNQHFIKQYKNTGSYYPKCFHKCHNNKQFIPRVYMFINHKMTHRYIYFRFTRHALQLHHVTMLNYLHGYKRLCCQNLAYRQTEIKWSFFVEHLNSWFAGTHENHENWYTTNKNEFTIFTI